MDIQHTSFDDQKNDVRPSSRIRAKTLILGVVAVAAIFVIVAIFVYVISKDKENELKHSIEKRLALLAGSRAEVISTWLSGYVNQGDRIVQSELFRLFAAEVDLLGDDVSLLVTGQLNSRNQGTDEVSQLEEQLPMMRRLLDEFIKYSGFRSGRLLNRNGQTYLATDAGTSPLTPAHRDHVMTVLSTNTPYFTPARHTANGLVMEFFLPIAPSHEQSPISVLLLSKAVSNKVNELLAKSPLMGEGERTRLIQKIGEEYQEIIPWMPGELRTLSQDLGFKEKNLAFGVRPSLTESRRAYSLGQKVPELDWWIVQESDYQIGRQTIRSYTRFFTIIGVLIVLFCTTSLGAVWWRLVGLQSQRSARRFKLLADQIDKQRRLLDSINNTITEFIALKDIRGFYQYVNPAFAKAFGRSAEEMIGMDDTALFGFDTSKRLEVSDQWVLENRASKNFQIDLYIQSVQHHLQISKVPFMDQTGKISGIVSLCKISPKLSKFAKKAKKPYARPLRS
jgi:PAS domain-containing protein